MRHLRPFAVLVAAAAASAALLAPARADYDKISNPAILEQLVKAVNDMVNDDGAGGLLDRIAASDRGRLEDDLKKSGTKDYEKLVDDFEKAWKEKYDHEFKPETHLGVLNEVPVSRFEYQGRDYASMNFSGSGDDDGFEVRLVRNKDTGNWRVAMSNRLSGERLVKRLNYSLEDLVENRKDWPKSESAAYAKVYRRLLGVLDYDAQQQREQTKKQQDEKKATKRR